MHSLKQIDKETERLYELLKLIQANKCKADTVWDNFCKEMNKKKKSSDKKYFQKHPKNISNSSSEIFSPRQGEDYVATRNVNRPKSFHGIKFAQPIDDRAIVEDEEQDADFPAVEVVTIREEYPMRRSLSAAAEKTTKLFDRKEKKRKENIRRKNAWIKSAQDSGTKKPKEDEACRENMELKLQGIIEKCLNTMEDIRTQLDIGITPVDGLDDLERRKKRSSEFASRFSRNYLYQLNRHISDIKKIFKSPSWKSSSQNIFIVRQKVTWSCQSILQGLQAYLTHLPVSTTIAVPDKVKELLKEVATLCDTQRTCASVDVNSNGKTNELIDIFEVRSRCLTEKIDEYYTTVSAVSLQSQSKFSLLESSKARKKNNKSRYSMYNGVPVRKDAYWKRAVAALAKKKYNVQSKYKTAYFKHRPPVEKQPVVKPAIKTRPIEKKSSTLIKLKPTIDDDSIKTMMEIEREKNQGFNGREAVLSFPQIEVDARNGNCLVPIVERLVEKLARENNEVSQEQRAARCSQPQQETSNETSRGKDEERAGVVVDCQLVDKLVEVIRNHHNQQDDRKEVAEESHKDVAAIKRSKKERRKTITVTGARNAQLICIKDEDSLVEPLENAGDSRGPPEDRETCKLHADNLAADVGNEDAQNAKRTVSNGNVSTGSGSEKASRMKISRLPKVALQPLKMLPKKFALNILEYKINHLKARKGDHMYKKSRVKQPWILMGEISDRILDELLVAVGSEIEVSDVIEGIYASEFV